MCCIAAPTRKVPDVATLLDSRSSGADGLASERPARNSSSSLRRALRVLDGIAHYQGHPAGVSLTALAASLDMSKSTALRLIGPLREEGLVYQDQISGRYRLGPAAVRLGVAFVARVDLDLLAGDLLRDLNKQSGEHASIVLPGQHSRSAGSVVLIASTDLNAIALAGQGPRIAELLHGRGWWIESEGDAAGHSTLAAPVLDHRSRVIAAVELTLACGGFRPPGSAIAPTANLPSLGSAVRDCAARLSDRLGAPLGSSDLAVGATS